MSLSLARRFRVDQGVVVDAAGANPRPLKLTGVSVALDASWSPYIQATVTASPPSAADLTAIDPRAGGRLRCRLRAFDAAGVQVGASWSLDLGLRTRRRTFSRRGPTFQLDAATDEAKMQDYYSATPYVLSGFTANASDFVTSAMSEMGYPLGSLVYINGWPDVLVAAADAVRTPETSYWDYCSQLAETAGARFFFDENNVPTWAQPTWTPTPGTSDLVGIYQVDDEVSRDNPAWGNYALVQYTGNSPAQFAASDGGLLPRKGIVVSRARNKPANGNAATKVRTTAQARGRNLTVQAVADLTVRPNQLRRAAYQGQLWTGRVQSVRFDLPAGTMTVVLNVIE